MGSDEGWLGGRVEEGGGGPSFMLREPRSAARSSSDSMRPPRPPKDGLWKTVGREDSSWGSFPKPPTTAGLRGRTTLTLCRRLVVPLPPPPFSSLGGFMPAQSSRKAEPS